LKPANVMIDGHGRVRIADFGIAIAIEDETQTAEMSGTPAYMAPEQLAGKGATVRSDIYSLGLILYEVCSGQRAFTAATVAELRDRRTGTRPERHRTSGAESIRCRSGSLPDASRATHARGPRPCPNSRRPFLAILSLRRSPPARRRLRQWWRRPV
jgi:serine/threonine protein kinase